MFRKRARSADGWLVTCDGCGKEILAQVFPDRVVVIDKRHGCRHIAVIHRTDLTKVMSLLEQDAPGDTQAAPSPPMGELSDCKRGATTSVG